ncbi:hypothetical protein BDY21DRAFT_367302 [Lineolata rhizophorae]|uniref:Uncharacterized protein n=1 Tax=Lineolata rhizophorae TaxID=578093 RepID=A0A6A6NMW9_9PEZI|nr:hypothetical protein BDY21DRAFT_367302 [Lineolata rhizophorae]
MVPTVVKPLRRVGCANPYNGINGSNTLSAALKRRIATLIATLSLQSACELGARDPDFAWPVFRAFWAELTKPGLGRPPVMTSRQIPSIFATDCRSSAGNTTY